MNARQFARAQSKPLGPIRKLIRAVLHLIGIPITPLQVDQTAGLLYRPVLRARDENYLAGLLYLRDLAPEIVAPPPHAYTPLVLTATIESVVDKVRIDGERITEKTRTDTRVIEAVRPGIEGPILRQVLDPARETIQDIGQDEEHPRYGWARVLVGDKSCAFCAMLASRGAVYTSRAAAKGRGGPLDVYHTPHPDTRPGGKGGIVGGFCDCSVVQVYRDENGVELPWEGQDAWLALEDLWLKAEPEKRETGKDQTKANAFRQAWEKQVRAGKSKIYLPESLAA
ncbi:MAG: hypothetical protein ABWY20_02285 [Mycobacterium sp.]